MIQEFQFHIPTIMVFLQPLIYSIEFKPCIEKVGLTELPVAGTIVEKFLTNPDDFSISDMKLHILSEEDKSMSLPAGVSMRFCAMGEYKVWSIYDFKKETELGVIQGAEASKLFWIGVEKKIAVFTLHRLGIGMNGELLALKPDAEMDVAPLNFALIGAGIGIDLKNKSISRFYLSGMAVSFKNEMLSVAGSILHEGNIYAGELLIRVKDISFTAIAEYSTEGNFAAFAAVSARFGGVPAFFVTGIGFGFGYNKRLVLPTVDQVKNYPLVQAARGKLSLTDMKGRMEKYFVAEAGQKFLAFGVRFSTFGIADTSAVVTAGFGNVFELGLVGASEISVPPNCNKSPIAYAVLTLVASVKPAEGLVAIEARLTSESYIFSKACKLQGGFAMYVWFAGENSGDMVITLGGYPSSYNKPMHYPDVPRLGFQWRLSNNLELTGELYLALTPKELMAGGRLKAVYTLGKLSAYFIAAADFYLGWKPFYYEANIQVLIGASYRLDLWFIHCTFKIELGAGVHIWGPEFGGTAHVNWFIISFDINFGQKKPEKTTAISWNDIIPLK